MFITLIMVMITGVYAYVQTHQIGFCIPVIPQKSWEERI